MWKDGVKIFLRGMAMGAADVIPGVSGGTIAFITGIYDRILFVISRVHIQAIRILLKEGIKAFWVYVDGFFAICLLCGILLSVLIFSHVFSYLFIYYSIYLWSFFFGLVSMSGFYMLKQVAPWGAGECFVFVLGCVIAYCIGLLPVFTVGSDLWVFFLCGAVAVCAMVLPGISGSFVLLLLGVYGIVLEAVRELNMQVLSVFALGCFIGLLSFSRVLLWCLIKYRNISVAFLTGLMLGALGKLWPWRQTLESWDNGKGVVIPVVQKNIMPSSYEVLTGGSAEILSCLGVMVFAMGLVYFVERFSNNTLVTSR